MEENKTSCETMNCQYWNGKICTSEDYFNKDGEFVCLHRDDAMSKDEYLEFLKEEGFII